MYGGCLTTDTAFVLSISAIKLKTESKNKKSQSTNIDIP
jgi:hypothetical protein